MKRIISFALIVSLLAMAAVPSVALDPEPAQLYSFYSDNMLLRQNTSAVFAGTAQAGAEIKCSLFDENNVLCADGISAARSDGIFEISFPAPEGGFFEYTLVFTCNGTEFDRLTGIVFGELWLASGQSNMEMGLGSTSRWQEIQDSGVYGSKWVRFLQTPREPTVRGLKAAPVDVQDNLEGCYWLRADDSRIAEISGVAYYFADELMHKMNMPVGVLSVSLGGTPIRSWLSREVLEGSSDAMQILENHNEYISSSEWGNADRSYYTDMCTNYNARIYPLRRFNISGLVWYQGETELITDYKYGEYTVLFDLLQQSYTECFGYEKSNLPIVYTHLACYNYRTDNRHLQAFNAELTDIRQLKPDSRAVISVSDVPLDFDLAVASIHPKTKEPVGRRLADAACGLVYTHETPYSAASLKGTRIDGKNIYVTFNDVGDSLVCSGEVLYDFAVCGDDGIYYPANAEIVSADTVKIWRDDIDNPVSATYAFSQANCRANLWSTKKGENYMPVSPFVTDSGKAELYYYDMPWTDCEQEQFWRTATDEVYTGFHDLWDTEGCTYEICSGSAYEGTGGLKVTSDSGGFSLSENFIFTADGKNVKYNETSRKWSKYGTLKFMARNCGDSEITFDSAQIKTSNGLWFSPDVNGSGKASCTIPADGQWHCIELDLNELYLFGYEKSIGLGSFVLDEISSFTLSFGGKSNSCLEVDSFDFSPDAVSRQLPHLDFFIRIINTVPLLFKALAALIAG